MSWGQSPLDLIPLEYDLNRLGEKEGEDEAGGNEAGGSGGSGGDMETGAWILLDFLSGP